MEQAGADALLGLFASSAAPSTAPPPAERPAVHALAGVPRKLQIDLTAVLSAVSEPAHTSSESISSESTLGAEEGEQATPEQLVPATRVPWKEDDAAAQAEDDQADQAPATSRKQAWTPEEDTLLLDLVTQHGAANWSRIAAHLPSRIGKQCRERWHNHLSPEVKKESFSPEEDMAIMRAVAEHGTKWALIVKHIPGRTDNAIKNRWNSTTRKMLRVKRRGGDIPGVSDIDLQTMDAATIAKRMIEAGTDWCLPTPQPQVKRKLELSEGSRGKRGKRSSASPTPDEPLTPTSLPALDLLSRIAQHESEKDDCSSPRMYEAALLLGTCMPYGHASSSLGADCAPLVEAS